jgi:hypothetical protein
MTRCTDFMCTYLYASLASVSHSLPEASVRMCSHYPFTFGVLLLTGASDIGFDPSIFDLADQPLNNRYKGRASVDLFLSFTPPSSARPLRLSFSLSVHSIPQPPQQPIQTAFSVYPTVTNVHDDANFHGLQFLDQAPQQSIPLRSCLKISTFKTFKAISRVKLSRLYRLEDHSRFRVRQDATA